ncbi:MAG: AI-2E family transporter [Candidatus Cohnella colombiensis]|uniref:AI-2E family transporter n=1 Tax=Candidatus Cohnella colombiensis TaxID=3121368 RepID=A0AA95EX04_9BACL|nr:MAG: AI-2E family transporter [Cohnella sp.]
MEKMREFFTLPLVRRITVLLLFVILLFSLKSMLNLILLLFLVTFVMNSLQVFLTKQIRKVIPIHPNVVTLLIYIIIISGLVIGIANYVPKIINQISEIITSITHFLSSNQDDVIAQKITEAINKIEYKTYTDQALYYIAKLSKWLEVILIVIILSLFFLLQKSKVSQFTQKFNNSKLGWVYTELSYICRKFVQSFGKVIEVQLIIAVVNTVLTVVGLWILGYPYLFALSVMVLILSLVPVAGVMISFVPISFIGYQTGGWTLVIWTVVIILIIHAVETYILNPRLMASKSKLPMFYTFVVLVFGQHYFGIWGLIIGIPIFMFLLDLIEVDTSDDIKE